MRQGGSRAPRTEIVLLVALAVYGLFPLAVALIHAAQTHTVFTGADGLIGADGVLGADQLQYLAWARDAGGHGLAGDLFSLAPSGHVYLEPLFEITGLLWRAGLSLQLAYLIWKPVAVLALALAGFAWARRMFPGQPGARGATVILALFLCTPLSALFSWTQLGSARFRFGLYLLGDELLAANKLWGYVPSALALALVPVALLAVERALDPARGRDPADRTGVTRMRRRPLMLAAAASLIASWLHPWQGITLILIFAGLGVWRRGRGWWALAVPAIGAALPLGYYYVLSHADPAWKLAAQYELIGRLPALVLLAGFGPLALIAAAGLRRPGPVVVEQALLLWIGACFVTYFVNDAFAPHALQGLSFPFAVLAVRGARRVRAPALVSAAAIGLLTLPGLVYDARKFINTAQSPTVQYYLPHSDLAALRFVSGGAPGAGVLAPTPFAVVVPSQTGRAVWVGHGYWSRDYAGRSRQADRLFGGRMRPVTARAFVRGTGSTLLISDCRHHRADLRRSLGPIVASVHEFGCARVYVLRTGRASRR